MADNRFIIKFGGDTTELANAVQRANSTVNQFANQVKSLGSAMLTGFAVSQVAQFAVEVSKLAGEAEGVREAFDRLPNSIQLMENLKEATKGTVSELDLMKRAVMASNFDISLEALPRLLEFAAVRAKQTGQSVDYLVDSIVTGIGRKSKLILDNLGISAVQLTEALGGASTASSSIAEVADAVGKIADESLKKMGDLSENASTKLERLSASWVNVKVAIGDAANGTGVLGKAVDALTLQFNVFASKNLTFWEKLASVVSPTGMMSAAMKDIAEQTRKNIEQQAKQAQVTKEVDRALATFGNNMEAIKKAYQQHIYYKDIMAELANREVQADKKRAESIENIANLELKLTNLKEEQSIATGNALAKTNQEIAAIEKKIKALKELGTAEVEARVGKAGVSIADHAALGGAMKVKLAGVDPSAAVRSMADAQGHLADQVNMANDALLKQKEAFTETASRAASISATFGNMFGELASGSQKASDILRQSAANIIDQLYRIAQAQIIANASKLGIAGVVAATAGLAALRGLFSGLLSRGTGSSAGSMGGGGRGYGYSSFGGTFQGMGERIQIEVVGKISGRDLAIVGDNYSRISGRTG